MEGKKYLWFLERFSPFALPFHECYSSYHGHSNIAIWWKISQRVDLPEILSVSNAAPITSTNTGQVPSPDLTGANTHVVSLEGSRDRVGAKLLLEKLAAELGIELNLPWNFVPEKIALIGED